MSQRVNDAKAKAEAHFNAYQTELERRELHCLKGHSDGVAAVAFSPDGKHILSSSGDKTIRLWDVMTGENLQTFYEPVGGAGAVAFVPTGGRFLAGTNASNLNGKWVLASENVFRLWDVKTKKILKTFRGHDGPVWGVAVSPDGSRALSGGDDKTVRLWDVESGKEVRSFNGHSEGTGSVALSPDGKRAVSASEDDTARMGCGYGERIISMRGPYRRCHSSSLLAGREACVDRKPGQDPASLEIAEVR